ncbi:MAG: glycosyltransferase family 4 protein [Anaerolineae bacterium]
MRVAVVVPRYGLNIVGGAERHAFGFATAAAALGWDVEVWTTCALNHYSWRNELPAGEGQVGGLTVRRFPVSVWDERRYGEAVAQLHTGRLPSEEQQYDWLHYGPHSPLLYEHAARHSSAFDYVVGLPYAVTIVQYALHAANGRTILWPCLHDEPLAYLAPTRQLLGSTYGVFFNSPEEADLCTDRIRCRMNRWAVVGEGVELSFEGDEGGSDGKGVAPPYLMYAGRLEEGKGVGDLYEYFARYHRESGSPLKLALVGSGPLKPPRSDAFVWLGRVSDGEKARLLGRALALCNPSLNESFSLVMMDSWLARRPVLVHAGCAVTRGHARRSSGGLWYGNYDEFAACLDWFQANPAAATAMGEMGHRYATVNYSWPRVMERVVATLRTWESA